MHHLIDPATGAPADRGVVAVVAQADEAWWAEGVAKAALVAGVDDGPRRCSNVSASRRSSSTPRRAAIRTTRWEARMSAAMDPRVWWWITRASGIVAWVVVAAAVVWGLLASTKLIRKRGVPAWILDLHRYLGTLTIVFVVVHVGAI